MKMTHYLSLANLLANLPEILERLTTSVRRREPRSNRARLHLQSSQSPPQASERRNVGLWAYRLRVERPEYLSAHLRRDIGLDL
jgi:hypothetical protein